MSKRSAGFTIVELSIAIAFLGILMMAILTLTIAAGQLYVKGDTNKTINQAGRDFADTVRRDLLASGMGSIVHPPDSNAGTTLDPLLSGRICLGSVVYLWNTADLLNSTANAAKVTIGASNTPIKFVRILHPQVSYCDADPISSKYPMNIASTESATELFGGTGREYALYAMSFTAIARNNGDKGMYDVSYTLGTNDPGTTERDPAGYIRCKPNNAILGNFNYCSVSGFDMLARIGGTK